MTARAERPTVVVLFGGAGAPEESTTSCSSAAEVVASLDPRRHDVVAVGITEDARWVAADASEALDGPESDRALRAVGTEVDPRSVLRPGDGQVVVVFPLVNELRPSGPNVASLCEVLDVACVGADSVGSSLARDKSLTRRIASSAGIAQPAWSTATREGGVGVAKETVRRELGGYPVFVKPASFGYSVGISKVRSDDELADALDAAFGWDDVVLVEEAIPGREIEMGLIGYDEPRTSTAGEIIPRSEFYTYEDKISEDGACQIVPVELPLPAAQEVERMTRSVCVATRCLGMARVDAFYDEGGRGVVFNEVNNVPGFTRRSIFPKVWAAAGLAMPELVDELIGAALRRHETRRRWLTP